MIEQYKKISKRKLAVMYCLVGILVSFFILKDGMPNDVILSMASPYNERNHNVNGLLNKVVLGLTDINIKDPYSFLTSITPSKYYGIKKLAMSGELRGYFAEDDLNGKVSLQDILNSDDYRKVKEVDVKNFDNTEYVYNNYFMSDGKIQFRMDMLDEFNFHDLATKSLALKSKDDGPKVLIFHTHVYEMYSDGKTGVVDVGEKLKDIFENKYGLKTMHVTDSFYAPGKKTTDKKEYDRMEPVIEKIIAENPSIEIVIDLHRDALDTKLVTDINGKPTAPVMFVNGLSRDLNNQGEIEKFDYLENSNLAGNIAFSLQCRLKMDELYPGFGRRIMFKAYRYSTYMRPNSLLIELGSNLNTGEEALNAAEPLANVIAKVVEKD